MQTFENELVPSRRAHGHDSRREAGPQAEVGRALAAGHHESLQPAGILHLQRAAGNASVAQLLGDNEKEEERSPVLDVVGSGGGQPLEDGVRSGMETRFGHDFGDVRVHTDTRASESARAVQAHAYTVGSDIVFQSDRYAPSSSEGQRMLAHELTHVVQQRSGPVDGTPAGGGVRISDPSDRFEREAEATADRVMSAPVAPVALGGESPSAVQRQEEEAPEEEVQGFFVQRQEGEEAEEEEPAAG